MSFQGVRAGRVSKLRQHVDAHEELENRYRFTPVVRSNSTPSALIWRFVLWAFRAARSRWAGCGPRAFACHSGVDYGARRCTFVDVAGPGRCGCRRLVGQVGGTAGDRRWSSVTALLGDAPSTLDRFSSALYTVAEAARYLDVPASTFTSWAKGYRRAGKGRPA
jgi:hypothetical protein